MPLPHDATCQDYLMHRRGVQSLIAAFSKTMDELELDGQGLSHLMQLRKQARERDDWNEQFDVFYERWISAFARRYPGESPRHCAIRDAGLQCLGELRNHLRNDLWTDKAMQGDPEPERYGRLFWAQVNQKMIYPPIMIALGVSRETAIRMTKFAPARIEVLKASTLPFGTEQALFEKIAEHIDKPWATVEKIGSDLPRFLEARDGSGKSLLELDEFDFLEPMPAIENLVSETGQSTSLMLFDVLPVGSVSALDVVVPDVINVLSRHCLPELKTGNRKLYDEFLAWQQKIYKEDKTTLPDVQGPIHRALQSLRDCIERTFKSRLKRS